MNQKEWDNWKAVTASSTHKWVEDEIYRLNGHGIMYYTGGENGSYMQITSDGELEYIGEAVFEIKTKEKYSCFNDAFQIACQMGGKKFLLDIFSSDQALQEMIHGLSHEADACKFILRPAAEDEAALFFALPKEQDLELAAIGHVRIDFGRHGNEFRHTWWPRGDEAMNSPEFKEELVELVNELRESGPLKNLSTMYNYCARHNGEIKGGWRQNYGYIIETECYRYCLRCSPGQGDYHAYLTAFDLQA